MGDAIVEPLWPHLEVTPYTSLLFNLLPVFGGREKRSLPTDDCYRDVTAGGQAGFMERGAFTDLEAGLIQVTARMLDATRLLARQLPPTAEAQTAAELQALENRLDRARTVRDSSELAVLARELERFGRDLLRIKRAYSPELLR